MRQPSLVFVILIVICTFVQCRTEIDTPVVVDFSIQPSDSSYSAPTYITITNHSKGALFYKWTFSDSAIASSSQRIPEPFQIAKAGVLYVTLEAWNDYARDKKTVELVLNAVPVAAFSFTAEMNEYAPAKVDFLFEGTEAKSYEWHFGGGTPANSADPSPGGILFSHAGSFPVKLIITNAKGIKDSIEKVVKIKPPLSAAFEVVPEFDDDDWQTPVNATLQNATTSATKHLWECEGATISNSSDSMPHIVFKLAGNYIIRYTATNDKQTEVVERSVEVKENSRLRIHKDIKLGINSAHKTIGSFYSTSLRKVFPEDSVNASIGSKIDICYFGLSHAFSYNKFVSPTSVGSLTFKDIPSAVSTRFINNLSKCNCGLTISAVDFDNINNGAWFDRYQIPDIHEDLSFSNTEGMPVILFQNAAGKKGAIKVKEFVAAGNNSFIICDIKIQKD